MGGTDHGATTAFDTIEEIVIAHLVQIPGPGVPVQLLREQADRTGLGANPTADTGQGRPWVGGLVGTQGQETVDGLGHGHVQVVAGKTHHGPADEQAPQAGAQAAGLLDEVPDGDPDGHLQVAGLTQSTPRQSDDARDEGLAVEGGIGDGGGGGDVLADDADLGRNPPAGHLLAGEDANELLLPPRGIEGGDGDDFDARRVPIRHQGLAQGQDGLGFVVLDRDQALIHPQQVPQQAGALEDAFGLVPHQAVVATDVGLALGAVDDEGPDADARRGGQLDAAGKGGAPQADDARPADALAQHLRVGSGGERRRQLGPGVLAVGLDQDAGGAHAGGMGDRTLLDGDHGPGTGGMDRRAQPALRLADQLPLEDPVADRDHRLGRSANVLTQGDDELTWQGGARQGGLIRQRLLVRQMQATGEGPERALAGAEPVGVQG